MTIEEILPKKKEVPNRGTHKQGTTRAYNKALDDCLTALKAHDIGVVEPYVEGLLKELSKLDCGDNSCFYKGMGKGGMRTNGGCRCLLDVRPPMLRQRIGLWYVNNKHLMLSGKEK